MIKKLLVVVPALYLSFSTQANPKEFPEMSFEKDNLSTSGFRGCFPGRTIYDLNPLPGNSYSAESNGGVTNALSFYEEGGVNHVSCPTVMPNEGQVAIISHYETESGTDTSQFDTLYRKVPFPQITHFSVTEKGKVIIKQEVEYKRGGFSIYHSPETMPINNNERMDYNLVTFSKGDGAFFLSSSGVASVLIKPIIYSEPIKVNLPEEYSGLTNYQINNVHFDSYTPNFVIEEIAVGENLILLNEEGEKILSAPYQEGGVTLNVQSTIDEMCGKCEGSELILEEARDSMERNSGLMSEQTRAIGSLYTNNVVLERLMGLNEKWISPAPPNVTKLEQLGLKIEVNSAKETILTNNTALPIAFGVLADFNDTCGAYSTPFSPTNIVRPSNDVIERALQQALNINTTVLNVDNGIQQIEILTPGERKNLFPFSSVETFIDNNAQCSQYKGVRGYLETISVAGYLQDVFNTVIDVVIKTKIHNPASFKQAGSYDAYSEKIGRVAERIKAMQATELGSSSYIAKLQSGDEEASILNTQLRTTSAYLINSAPKACNDAMCQMIFKTVGNGLKNYEAEKQNDKIVVGLTKDATELLISKIGDSAPSSIAVAGAKIAINTYQTVKDNLLLDELMFLQIPELKQSVGDVTISAFDIAGANLINVYGENTYGMTYYFEQNGQRYEGYKGRVRTHSQYSNYQIRVSYTPAVGLFTTDSPVYFIAKGSNGHILYKQELDTYDGREHPMYLSMGMKGLLYKGNNSYNPGENTSFALRLYYEGDLIFENPRLTAPSRSIHTRNAGLVGNLTEYNKFIGSTQVIFENSYRPGNYTAEYRILDEDVDREWMPFPRSFVVPGGLVDYKVCGKGYFGAEFSNSLGSRESSPTSISERIRLDVNPNSETCVSFNDVVIWDDVWFFSMGAFDEASYSRSSFSRIDASRFSSIRYELKFGNDEPQLLKKVNNGSTAIRTSWRHMNISPQKALW